MLLLETKISYGAIRLKLIIQELLVKMEHFNPVNVTFLMGNQFTRDQSPFLGLNSSLLIMWKEKRGGKTR